MIKMVVIIEKKMWYNQIDKHLGVDPTRTEEINMITIFNRAELFVDVNQEAAANVWSTLKANGIEYEMTTKQDVAAIRKALHYFQGMSSTAYGMPGSYYGDTPNYVYKIYVRRADLARAKEVCSLR